MTESILGVDGKDFPAYEAVKACLRAPVFEYNGARKIVQSVGFTIMGDEFPEVSLTELGYNQNIKTKALFRMYYNEDEVQRVTELLHRRRNQAFTAVSMSMRAGSKDPRSMGHCMDSIIISTTKKRCVVEVVYRSTEVIKKHSADLAFIPLVLDRMDVEPDEIKFYFTNAYLSGVFFPTLFRWWDPIDFLGMLREREPKLFIVATRFLRRSVMKKEKDFPYAPERQQHLYAWKHYPARMKDIRDYLEEYL